MCDSRNGPGHEWHGHKPKLLWRNGFGSGYERKWVHGTERNTRTIRFEAAGTVLATCCGRGEPRQFTFDQIITADMRDASEVLMPEEVGGE
ncbi:hypothetical protein [Neorhodopirellula lusitana]|uniref:hypothetical protein n=1 Tax=Neorhodopirellula lusitana TaxID=445327 RepID=UPI0024B7F58D|nr:hypothetical protein [Neorhodopirellula lusitana]